MENLYSAYNGTSTALTAALAPVTTGVAIKTLLQLATPSTTDIRIAEWGITFDGAPSAIKAELIDTGAINATVTALVAQPPLNDANGPVSKLTYSTAGTGFTSTVEGTITATRVLDYQLMSSNNYVKMWPLGREPRVAVSKFVRIRVTAAVAVNAICWIIWKEG
jgi:hypothetical protein